MAKQTRTMAAQIRRVAEERRRQAGLVLDFVSRDAYRFYVDARRAARRRVGKLDTEDAVYRGRHAWQRGVARRINRTICEGLLTGLVGLTATLTLPRELAPKGSLAPFQELRGHFQGFRERLRARLDKVAIRPALVFWAAEPQRSGYPHWHLTVLVNTGDEQRTWEEMQLSVHAPKPGKAPRRASQTLLKASGPIVGLDVCRDARGYFEFLSWIEYSLKARVWRRQQLQAKGYADLLQFEAWAHANGYAPTFGPSLCSWSDWVQSGAKRRATAVAAAAKRAAAKAAAASPSLPTASPVTGLGAAGTPSGVCYPQPAPAAHGSAAAKKPAKAKRQGAGPPATNEAARTRRYRERAAADGKRRIEVLVPPDLEQAVRGVARGELLVQQRSPLLDFAAARAVAIRELERRLRRERVSNQKIREEMAKLERTWRPPR